MLPIGTPDSGGSTESSRPFHSGHVDSTVSPEEPHDLRSSAGGERAPDSGPLGLAVPSALAAPFARLDDFFALDATAAPVIQPVAPATPVASAAPPVYDLVEPAGSSSSLPAIFPFSFGTPPTPEPEPRSEAVSPPSDIEPAPENVVGPVPATLDGAASIPPTSIHAPIQPIAGPPVPTDDDERVADEPRRQSVFSFEASGPEPTPLDQRVARSARLFWLWFAANSSVLSLAFGGAIFSLGMSLRQAIVAAFIGVAISFLPLGLITLAGKKSGQPTMIVSRATFGFIGNAIPAVLAVITRLFWGAVLLWIISASTARILVGARLGGPLSELQITIIAMAVGFVLALIVAFFGYPLFARIQLVLSIFSGILVIGLVAITWPSVDIAKALTVGDGPWILVVTGVVLVFSFVGLVWASGSAELARYQRPSSSGATAMLWAPLGTTLPAFLLIAYGAVLAASSPTTATGLVRAPLDTIALMMPTWYPIPLIAATVLSLLSGVILSIYSGGFALQAAGLRVPRVWSTVIVGALLFSVAMVLSVTVDGALTIFRDLATTLAVPVAAWAGIFAAEMIIRRRRFDTGSLLKRGGVYPDVNWVNLSMLIVASVIGFGLTTAAVGWLGWEGYLFTAFGVPLSSDLAGTDLGVLVALALGLLTPLAAGVPTIRRQERAQV